MARIGNFRRDVEVLVSKTMGPYARREIFVKEARKILYETRRQNRQALGVDTPYQQIVDGNIGAPLTSINPDGGTIVFRFELFEPVLRWIHQQLMLNSPVLTGRYQASHVLLADGDEVDDPDTYIPPAEEYFFINLQPYSRKIERGLSKQAPLGVYQETQKQANARFGNIAKIKFSYRSIIIPAEAAARFDGDTRAVKKLVNDSRNPAIIVTMR